MVNVFLQYSITIPFLIMLTSTSARSCVYNRTAMLKDYENALINNIENVKESLSKNFSHCSNSKKIKVVDVCSNLTKVDEIRHMSKATCLNVSRDIGTFCCQLKNLVYWGCFLKHQLKNLKINGSAEIGELKKRLTTLVRHSNNNLCLKSSNHRTPGRPKPTGSSKRGEKNSERSGDISRLIETLHSYATCWQEFSVSNDCK
ncbi:hypothetical protein GDO81_011331 [Engystomops pustulosus]|uniref:Interleukin-7 n=1 Tax=Engystomops pustulosus TaxID=76066 RepID=A0AAV7BDR9_ENGPU|nr:hypothetical protein GDO81_011331 [Engystomops pustulosus]